MSRLRRTLLASLAVGAATVGLMPTADAAPAGDQFEAQSVSSALRISLFGQSLTVGSASSDISSDGTAHAKGEGATVVTQGFGGSEATVTAPGTDGSTVPVCGPLVLPEAVPALDLSTACSSAIASSDDGGLRADAEGKALELTLAGTPELAALPITDLSEALLGGLAPLFGFFPVPGDVVVDQLNTLLEQAITGDGVKVLTVEGGESEARSASTAESVTSTSKANGATIKVIDRSLLGLQPILTIEIGESTTEVVRNRATGETTAAQTAVPVRLTVAPDVAFLLGLPESTFEVPSGQQVDLPLPAPLTSSIKVSGGSTSEIENGMKAESATIELDLLSGINGGIQLGVSAGSSAVAGTVAPAPAPTTVPTTVQERQVDNAPPARTPARTTLPRTGAEQSDLNRTALLLALAATGVGGLVLTASRRSRRAAAEQV